MRGRLTAVAGISALLAVAATITGFAATLGVDSGTIDTFAANQQATTTTSTTSTSTTTTTTTTTTTVPAGTTLYLKTSTPGQNVSPSSELPLSTSAPTVSTLYNYDTGRDGFPGLLIQKGNSQRWTTTGPLATTKGTFTFWSQMKDGNNDKKGSVRVRLQACNSNFKGCEEMVDTTLAPSGKWHPTNNVWVSKTINFATFGGHNLNNEQRVLVLDVFVADSSGDDMWFAYDTTDYPSRLVLE